MKSRINEIKSFLKFISLQSIFSAVGKSIVNPDEYMILYGIGMLIYSGFCHFLSNQTKNASSTLINVIVTVICNLGFFIHYVVAFLK